MPDEAAELHQNLNIVLLIGTQLLASTLVAGHNATQFDTDVKGNLI